MIRSNVLWTCWTQSNLNKTPFPFQRLQAKLKFIQKITTVHIFFKVTRNLASAKFSKKQFQSRKIFNLVEAPLCLTEGCTVWLKTKGTILMDDPWSPIGNSYHVLYQALHLEVNCIGVVINGLDCKKLLCCKKTKNSTLQSLWWSCH